MTPPQESNGDPPAKPPVYEVTVTLPSAAAIALIEFVAFPDLRPVLERHAQAAVTAIIDAAKAQGMRIVDP